MPFKEGELEQLANELNEADRKERADAERKAFCRQAAIELTGYSVSYNGDGAAVLAPDVAWGLARELWEAKPDDL